MIDRYLGGKVSRISPEAPVPILHLETVENRLGGAANVALNIKAMGATPYLCSIIGADEEGKIMLDLLQKNELAINGLTQSSERRTTVKTRVIAQNQHLLRVDKEDKFDLTKKETRLLLKKIRSILAAQNIHAILFQDYNKGILTTEVIEEVLAEAQKRDIPTTVDPKFHNFWAYRGVTLFKPNLKEVSEQVSFPISIEKPSLRKAAHAIRTQLGNTYTLITLSDKGLYIDEATDGTIINTKARQIADVCGAGDTVISIATLGIAMGLDIKQIAILSNLAGGQVCEKVGVVAVDKEQLEKEWRMENGKWKI